MLNRKIAAAAAILAAAVVSSSSYAATIADVKAASTTSGNSSTIGSAVVTYVISSKAFLVQDATGADEIYLGSSNSTGYTPTVGDQITATGNSYNFHNLYELEAYTPASGTAVPLTISKTGTGTVPAPTTFTTAILSTTATALPFESELGNLNDVTFASPSGNFTSSGTYTVTDGTTSATIYIPSGSALIGTAVPSTPVNINGYLGFYTTPEFDPISITPFTAGGTVPEPTSIGLLATGGLLALRRRRMA